MRRFKNGSMLRAKLCFLAWAGRKLDPNTDKWLHNAVGQVYGLKLSDEEAEELLANYTAINPRKERDVFIQAVRYLAWVIRQLYEEHTKWLATIMKRAFAQIMTDEDADMLFSEVGADEPTFPHTLKDEIPPTQSDGAPEPTSSHTEATQTANLPHSEARHTQTAASPIPTSTSHRRSPTPPQSSSRVPKMTSSRPFADLESDLIIPPNCPGKSVFVRAHLRHPRGTAKTCVNCNAQPCRCAREPNRKCSLDKKDDDGTPEPGQGEVGEEDEEEVVAPRRNRSTSGNARRIDSDSEEESGDDEDSEESGSESGEDANDTDYTASEEENEDVESPRRSTRHSREESPRRSKRLRQRDSRSENDSDEDEDSGSSDDDEDSDSSDDNDEDEGPRRSKRIRRRSVERAERVEKLRERRQHSGFRADADEYLENDSDGSFIVSDSD